MWVFLFANRLSLDLPPKWLKAIFKLFSQSQRNRFANIHNAQPSWQPTTSATPTWAHIMFNSMSCIWCPFSSYNYVRIVVKMPMCLWPWPRIRKICSSDFRRFISADKVRFEKRFTQTNLSFVRPTTDCFYVHVNCFVALFAAYFYVRPFFGGYSGFAGMGIITYRGLNAWLAKHLQLSCRFLLNFCARDV